MKRNIIIAIVAIVVAGVIAHLVHMFAAGHGTHGRGQDNAADRAHLGVSEVPQ